MGTLPSAKLIAREHALHYLQHWRRQLALRGQQHAHRKGQRGHLLPHRHVQHDVLHQVCSRL
jgi:hypothetical protein